MNWFTAFILWLCAPVRQWEKVLDRLQNLESRAEDQSKHTRDVDRYHSDVAQLIRDRIEKLEMPRPDNRELERIKELEAFVDILISAMQGDYYRRFELMKELQSLRQRAFIHDAARRWEAERKV